MPEPEGGRFPYHGGMEEKHMSTNPPKIEDPVLDCFQKRLRPFVEIARKPRIGFQRCYFCEKQIMKCEWRVKTICGYGEHDVKANGIHWSSYHPIYLYCHLSCFLMALKAKLKKGGLSIGIHKRTLAQLKRERVKAALMH